MYQSAGAPAARIPTSPKRVQSGSIPFRNGALSPKKM